MWVATGCGSGLHHTHELRQRRMPQPGDRRVQRPGVYPGPHALGAYFSSRSQYHL